MTYIRRDDIPNPPGDQVVELDTGHLVAIGCARARDGSSLVLRARACVIDDHGATISDGQGRPISVVHAHTATADALALHGADALARDCLMLVLGEPTELPFTQEARTAASIRSAIAAAEHEGEVDAGALL